MMRQAWIDKGAVATVALTRQCAVFCVDCLKDALRALNGERPHQALANLTPDAVYKSTEGGGAMILDKYGAMPRLPIPLRSTGTAFDEDSTEIPAIPNTRTGAAPSSCVAIECNLN